MAELFDALQLGSLCKQSQANIRLNAPLPRRASRFHQSDAGVTVFVDATNGKDDQPMAPTAGSIGTPFKTVAAAIEFTRERRAKSPGMAATVFLRGNAVHYLSNTISLTAADSRLTIAGYNGEPAVVSGGVLVQATWEENSNGIYVADLSKVNLPAGVPALQFGDPLSGSGSITRGILARFPNANPEIDLFPTGYVMAKAQWRPPLYRGMACNPRTQCGTSVNVTYATPDSEWHGVHRPVFFVPTALFLLAIALRCCAQPSNATAGSASETDYCVLWRGLGAGMYQNWTTGVGGACDVYDPPRSPWCSGVFYLERQFPEMHTRHPSGVYADDLLAHGPYANPAGSVIHAWRPGHW